MSVSLAVTPTIDSTTFFRNKSFSHTFSVSSTIVTDASLYFGNSTASLLACNFTSGSTFASASGFPFSGNVGTLSVDAVVVDPQYMTTATPPAYFGVQGMCADPSGNLYFAVESQNTIYKLDPSGTVTTFAGTGSSGNTNGDRLNATFTNPVSVATDGSGTFYVGESYGIRKIDPSGTVTQFVGSNIPGYVDTSGTRSRFAQPSFLTVHPNGTLYVSDLGANAIRAVDSNGNVTTYASGPGTATGQARQLGVYGGFSTGLLRSADAQTYYGGIDASFTGSLLALSVSPGGYVLGGIPSVGGSLSSSTDGVTWFNRGSPLTTGVRTIGYDGSGGLWVAGGGTLGGGSTNTLAWSSDASTWTSLGATTFDAACRSVAYGNGVWVAAGQFTTTLAYSTNATSWTSLGTSVFSTAGFGVTYANGTWVAVGLGTNVAARSTDGSNWTPMTIGSLTSGRAVGYGNATFLIAGGTGGTDTDFYTSMDGSSWTFRQTVAGVACNVYWSSNLSQWIASFPAGTNYTSTDGSSWTQVSGSFGTFTLVDVPFVLSRAVVTTPQGLLFDGSDRLVIAESGTHMVRQIQSNVASTLAGTGTIGNASGSYATAQFAYPTGLARDATGSFYVSDAFCNVIRKLSNGMVTTYAGTFGTAGTTNGRPSASLLSAPYGLQFIGTDLYIAESNAGDIRKTFIYPEVRPGTIRDPPNGTIVATSNYPILVNSRIDVSWTSVGGALPLYKYEPFLNSFTARLSACGDVLTYGTSATELFGYLTGTGTAQALFRGSNGATTAYPYSLPLVVRASNGPSFVDDVSTAVTINPARIIYSPCNANLVFYRNEPITPVTFSLVSSSAELMYSSTSLPNGLTLTTRADAKSFLLTGTPTTQSTPSNYTILAQDTLRRTYSTVVSMAVNPERLILDVSGSTTFLGVQSNVAVTPVSVIARCPPYTADRSLRYTWTPALPAGLQFRNISNQAVTSPYSSTAFVDPSFTLTLSGAVTQAQIEAFAYTNTRTYTVTLTGVRTSPTPSLSPSIGTPFTFQFDPIVLFGSNTQRLFVGIPIVRPLFYSAKTYFADVSIASMVITDGFVPDGTTGTFNSLQSRFDICGTPTFPGIYSFTLQATNSNGQTAVLPVTLDVSTDSVQFLTSSDLCYNFIQYRDLSNPVTGLYPSLIQISAVASSGCNVAYSSTTLPPGITVDASTGRLGGLPTAEFPLTTTSITATCLASGAASSLPLKISVSAEVFTFNDVSTFAVQQNVAIPATQITATTLSEQPILRYSSGNLPSALSVTNAGVLSGTVLGSNSGTFAISAYTIYTSGSKTYTYSVSADAVLLLPSMYTTVTAPGQSVSIPISGYSASGVTVNNFRFEDPFPYGLSVNPTSGLLSGTLSSSLPASVPFTILGSAGLVDGSLGGLMTTTNLTVNRAQVLRLEAGSNLSIYSSDTNGLTWSLASGSTISNATALTIGTNGSNIYLVPISGNTVLKSTDGASYTAKSFTGGSPFMTAIVNKPGTSTWWMAGSRTTGVSTRAVYLYTSTDDGETWDAGQLVSPLTDRGGSVEPYASPYQAYLNGGVALAYKDGVLLIGGDRILRSTDEGATWSAVGNGFQAEVAAFSLDQQDVWIATGSDLYQTRTSNTYTSSTATIKLSTDKGLTWTNASAFSMFGYDVRYGNGQWMATGIDVSQVQVRYSLDGLSWGLVSDIPSLTYPSAYAAQPPLPISLGFDETDWIVLRTPDDGTVTRYAHPFNTPFPGGWTSTTITSSFPGASSTTRLTSYVAQTIDPGADVTTIMFAVPPTGPLFVEPAQSTFVFWQYMPIPPLTFRATGTEPISYFVSALPVGLRWDATTRSITGACMQTGTRTVTVYAKNVNGITAFPITVITDVPRILKQQTGAGAYTSLVRQYTEVNAAQTARDTRALPDQTTGIGEFASPYPPSVVTPSYCPC